MSGPKATISVCPTFHLSLTKYEVNLIMRMFAACELPYYLDLCRSTCSITDWTKLSEIGADCPLFYPELDILKLALKYDLPDFKPEELKSVESLRDLAQGLEEASRKIMGCEFWKVDLNSLGKFAIVEHTERKS